MNPENAVHDSDAFHRAARETGLEGQPEVFELLRGSVGDVSQAGGRRGEKAGEKANQENEKNFHGGSSI
jgi:hypothetical protein